MKKLEFESDIILLKFLLGIRLEFVKTSKQEIGPKN